MRGQRVINIERGLGIANKQHMSSQQSDKISKAELNFMFRFVLVYEYFEVYVVVKRDTSRKRTLGDLCRSDKFSPTRSRCESDKSQSATPRRKLYRQGWHGPLNTCEYEGWHSRDLLTLLFEFVSDLFGFTACLRGPQILCSLFGLVFLMLQLGTLLIRSNLNRCPDQWFRSYDTVLRVMYGWMSAGQGLGLFEALLLHYVLIRKQGLATSNPADEGSRRTGLGQIKMCELDVQLTEYATQNYASLCKREKKRMNE